MSDTLGLIVWLLSAVVKLVVYVIAYILSFIYSIKDKKLGDWFYGMGIGNDIFGNKLIAPVANHWMVKAGGRKFGGNETISLCMALNKQSGHNTKFANGIEKIINVFQKDHLQKTLEKSNIATQN